MAYAPCIRCDDGDYLIDGLCEPCRVESIRLRIHAIESDGREVSVETLLFDVCGYCRAQVPAGGVVQHDIRSHGGLQRVREDHALVCQNPNRVGSDCFCRVQEYEAVAAGINR